MQQGSTALSLPRGLPLSKTGAKPRASKAGSTRNKQLKISDFFGTNTGNVTWTIDELWTMRTKDTYLPAALIGRGLPEADLGAYLEIRDHLRPLGLQTVDYRGQSEDDAHHSWGDGHCLLHAVLFLGVHEFLSESACWTVNGYLCFPNSTGELLLRALATLEEYEGEEEGFLNWSAEAETDNLGDGNKHCQNLKEFVEYHRMEVRAGRNKYSTQLIIVALATLLRSDITLHRFANRNGTGKNTYYTWVFHPLGSIVDENRSMIHICECNGQHYAPMVTTQQAFLVDKRTKGRACISKLIQEGRNRTVTTNRGMCQQTQSDSHNNTSAELLSSSTLHDILLH